MAGDTDNPRIWYNADAYVAPVGSDQPDDLATPWPGAWDALGLLDEAGMGETRTEDVQDKYAWGGILYRTTRSKHKRQLTITALEDNPTVWGLVNPGSSADSSGGITTRSVLVPIRDRRAFGFETIDGDITRRRVVPTAEVTAIAEIKDSDSDTTMYALTLTVYPDADKLLWIDITDDPQADEGS